MRCATGVVPLRNCSLAWASVAALERMRSPSRTSRRAVRSSNVLAIKTVQVTSDAKASPIRTPFTRRSASWNMPHGDRSCGSCVRLTVVWPTGCSVAAGAAAFAGADGASTAGGAAAGGVTGCVAVGAAGAAAFCACADGANGLAISSALPSTANAAAKRNRFAREVFCISNGPLCCTRPRPVPNRHSAERM